MNSDDPTIQGTLTLVGGDQVEVGPFTPDQIEEQKRIEEETYYQRRAEREHREELRAACVVAASRIFNGSGHHTAAKAVTNAAAELYEWVKESE